MSDQENQPDPYEMRPVAVRSRLKSSGFFPSVYAHHISVQPIRDEVLLSFFEVAPPLLQAPTEEDVRQLENEGVPAECVAKVVVSRRVFLEMAELLNRMTNLVQAGQPNQLNGDEKS